MPRHPACHAAARRLRATAPVTAAALWLAAALPAAAGSFDCVIEPRTVVDVRAATEGLIEQVLVDRGDRIKAGQLLLTLDSRVERATLDQARHRAAMVGGIRSGESRVDYAALKLARREKLAQDQFVSSQDRDEAAAEKRLAEAELVQAREAKRDAELDELRSTQLLALRSLRSPLNGVVVERMAHPGDLADNRDLRKPLLRVADISVLHVEVLLPVAAYGKLRPGAPVTVRPESPIGGSLAARVKTVDPVADVASGTFRVRLELPNPDLKLPAGITCQADIPGLERPAAAPRRPAAMQPQPTLPAGGLPAGAGAAAAAR